MHGTDRTTAAPGDLGQRTPPRSGPPILGSGVDPQGRCVHWATDLDVVANWCSTCRGYWACHCCHSELAGHPFGRPEVTDPDTVLCGVCGATFSYAEYALAPRCPRCGHGFNPRCSRHAALYVRGSGLP